MERLTTPEDLAAAVGRLTAAEPRFAHVVARHGLPALRHAEPGLASLLRIITDQMISLAAGEAIWTRLSRRLGCVTPQAVLGCPQAELQALGLSATKARTFHAAAHTVAAGLLPDAPAGPSSDDHVMRVLTGIPGVGPWTANLYLLTVQKAPDAWPAADVALQRAAADLLSLPERPSGRDMARLAEPWRPCRSAAALLLWSHYRGLKQMPQA